MMAAFPNPEVVVRRLSVLAAVLAALLLGCAGVALADPPFRLIDRVTDEARTLTAGQAAEVAEAIERLRAEDGIDLFVVYVDSFDGAAPQAWADQTAQLSQFGTEDVLLAVATADRAYYVSIADGFPLSEAATDRIRSTDVEPRLRVNDWAGAAIALADGLRTDDSAGSGDAPGGVPVGVLIVGGAALLGGGAWALRRRRRRAHAAPPAAAEEAPTASGPGDEFAGVTTEDLAYRASSALIEVDDAVRTSEQELSAARAHFGEEAVAGFSAALEQSRADMLAAFEIRQRLDDDQPEDEPVKRAMYAEIIRACRTADERLDAQAEAFDGLRDLESRAPEYIAGLRTRLDAVTNRTPGIETRWATLQGHYAPSALTPVAGNIDQARQLLAAADAELAEADTELAEPGPAVAVLSGRAAEDAITQAETLLDGVPRLEAELADAATRITATRVEVMQDLAEARAVAATADPGGLVPVVARAEAAVVAADQAAAGPRPDPIAALRLLDDAGTALDQGLARARDAQDRARRAAAVLDQALLTARSAVAAAGDFVATRRGAVGSQARTRLAEAQRHLQRVDGGDPVVALREAQQADALAQEALRLAQEDVSRWSVPTSATTGGAGVDLGSLILGGILSGAAGGRRSGGRGSGGRRSPGSFGGSASRGRRGGGGRF